jgi:histidinol dehydrogenase
VYSVFSRRSGGLSVGINLFPDRKRCSFDCPYCEVFPFSTGAVYSQEQMEGDLRAALAAASGKSAPVKDICFSGNGEPAMSPAFPEALERAGRIRAETAPRAGLVLITNGAGLLDGNIFSLLRDAATGPLALDIWLKLDAGTPAWYGKMSRSAIPFDKIVSKVKEFSRCAPVTIQTMLCAVDGEAPPPEEEEAWERLVLELAAASGVRAESGKERGPAIRKIQIYGKARPAPEDPKSAALPREYLEKRARSLRAVLAAAFAAVNGAEKTDMPPVEVYQ